MVTYLAWWYGQEPALLWQAVKVITKKVYHNFSITLLARTLFDPWKRDIRSAQNASLDVVFKLAMDNIISRFIGAIIRFFTILTGLGVTLATFVVLLAIFIFWLAMPLIILFLIIHGISLISGGSIQ